MVPILAIEACVFAVALASVFVVVYRHRTAVRIKTDSDDEEEDDEEAQSATVGGKGEEASLIDGGESSSDPRDPSLLGYVRDFMSCKLTCPTTNTRANTMKRKQSVVMQRRHSGTKKIHQSYFYPLLDETAHWFAEWEASKQSLLLPSPELEPSPRPADLELRIEMLKEKNSSSPKELLECIPLSPFRSNAHMVRPVTVS